MRASAGFDRRLILPMIVGSILNPINSSMIAVALVPIGVALGAPPSKTAWLVSGLYLATAVGQPVVGRLIDLYGPRRLFLAGAILVGLGGLLGALAPSIAILTLARVLIGFGTCSGYPAAMFLIRSEGERTGQESPASILTALAVATQTVAVVGPSLGGLLITLGGWRMIFTVNVPLSALSVILGATLIPSTTRLRSPAGEEPRGPAARPSSSLVSTIDLAGIGLFVTALTSAILFLLDPASGRWFLPVVSAMALAALVRRELRAANPFLDLRLLGGNRPLLFTYGRSLLGACVSYSLLYGFTQWLEQGRGLSASLAGLVLLPIFATGIAVSTLTGRRPQIRGKLVVGSATQAAVAITLLFLGATSPLWTIVGTAVLAGVPQGLINLANQNAVYHQADPERIGSSAGLLRTFFYLGAITASVATGRFFRHGAGTAGMHDLAWFMLAAAVLFLIITVADRSLGRIRA